MEPPTSSIFLCAFTYGNVTAHTAFSLANEMREMDKRGITFESRNLHNDALISRSRSKALTDFLLGSRLDVCVMVDHDLEWEAGMLSALASKAHELQSCVAGIYACRGVGCGVATRVLTPTSFKGLEDKVIEAQYLATGFLAIPRVAAEEVLKIGLGKDESNQAIHPCKYSDGSLMYDFFRPISVPLVGSSSYEYLSEDYAFGWRCRAANPSRKLYAWTKPWLRHHGDYGFTVDQAYVERRG